jgi:hypothetical protein
MLTRMREAFDVAFYVLSTSPGVELKQFAVALPAGIIFDATVIRALLVPSLMKLFGSWNWWLPDRLARVLLVPPRPAVAYLDGLTVFRCSRACWGEGEPGGARTR